MHNSFLPLLRWLGCGEVMPMTRSHLRAWRYCKLSFVIVVRQTLLLPVPALSSAMAFSLVVF